MRRQTPTLRGRSLVPWLRGDPAVLGQGGEGSGSALARPVFFEKVTASDQPLKAMLIWPHKLIWNLGLNSFKLYDLSLDPAENDNLFGKNPELDQQLINSFKDWRTNKLKEIKAVDKI